MNKDVFEKKNADLYEQLRKLKDEVATQGAGWGLTLAEINQITLLCDEFRQQITTVMQKRTEFKAEVAKKKQMIVTHLNPLRKYLNRLKNPSPGFAAAFLPGFKSRVYKPDAPSYKPKLRAEVEGYLIRIRFKKLGAEQMRILGSCNGGEFRLLDTRLRSPFLFTPEPTPGSASQKWTFKALGVYRDSPIGAYSEAVTVLYESEPA